MADNLKTLTKGFVSAAEPKQSRYDIWDDALPGFGLRVGVGGSKTFVVRYRADGGGRKAPVRQVTIGRFGPLTVAHAPRRERCHDHIAHDR